MSAPGAFGSSLAFSIFFLGRRGAVSIRYNSLTFDLLLFAASLAIEVAPALFWMDVWFLRLTSRDL